MHYNNIYFSFFCKNMAKAGFLNLGTLQKQDEIIIKRFEIINSKIYYYV